MLKKMLRKFFADRQKIEFDDGSELEYLNREALMYSEPGGKTMEIPFYLAKGRFRLRVVQDRDISHWDYPNEGAALSEQKKLEIERRIIEYCERLRIPFELLRDK